MLFVMINRTVVSLGWFTRRTLGEAGPKARLGSACHLGSSAAGTSSKGRQSTAFVTHCQGAQCDIVQLKPTGSFGEQRAEGQEAGPGPCECSALQHSLCLCLGGGWVGA